MTYGRPLSAAPRAVGLYDGEHEHDACGVAFVATMRGTPGHDIVEHAMTALRNLDHRGATGADPDTGDGAGVLIQMPDRFLRESAGLDLPAAGAYAVGLAFLPTDADERRALERPGRADRDRGVACGCSPGATYRWRPSWSARRRATACPTSASSSSSQPTG